jgi:hypothetical protein
MNELNSKGERRKVHVNFTRTFSFRILEKKQNEEEKEEVKKRNTTGIN